MVSLGSPRTGEEEIGAVGRLLSEGELSVGDTVEEFEDAFADFTDTGSAAMVSSGSVALELALEVSDLDDGDGVIVSPFNCAAVLYSLVRQNLRPVFCDVRSDGFNISPGHVSERLEREDAEGLLLTHLYGQPCDMDELSSIADRHGLTVVNDFAQAPGATYDGDDVATYGDVGVCSFGATKNITTAEGGAVVSDDERLTERVRRLRSNTNGDDETPLRSVRMNDLEAAIGLEQLEKYDDILAAKRRVARIYRDDLTDEVALPIARPDRSHVYHGFPIRTDENTELMEYLAERNVETSVVYDRPLYDYTLAPDVDTSQFPDTEDVTDSVLLLPIHSNLSRDDADEVTAAVNSFFA